MLRNFNILHLLLAFCLGAVAGAALFPLLGGEASASNAEVHTIFSPEGEADVISALRSARETMDVEMYLFSYPKMADELIAAHSRGVHVRVLLEPTLSGNNPNLEMARTLRTAGIEVRWALPSRTNHAKFVILDGKRVLVGSHNWSFSAMNRNREASVVIGDAAVAADFSATFEEDWGAAYG